MPMLAPIRPRLAAALGALVIAVAPAAAVAADEQAAGGSIRATVQTDATIARVQAIGRAPRQITTSTGEAKDIGMYGKAYAGRLEGRTLIVEDLPAGRYDLRLVTGDGRIIEGWDADVPPSDYVEHWPLEDEDRAAIRKKLAHRNFSEFSDDMRVLDMRGNVQNAAVLVAKVRTRPFVGGGYKPGEWVYRVDRFRWEDPEEHTWVPARDRPFYALVRQRLYQRDYRKKSHVFAAHLGGIAIDAERAKVDLGPVVVPAPRVGVYAVEADGTPIAPTVIKGPAVAVPKFDDDQAPGPSDPSDPPDSPDPPQEADDHE